VGVGLGRVRRMGAVSIRPGTSNSEHFCQELTKSLPRKHVGSPRSRDRSDQRSSDQQRAGLRSGSTPGMVGE